MAALAVAAGTAFLVDALPNWLYELLSKFLIVKPPANVLPGAETSKSSGFAHQITPKRFIFSMRGGGVCYNAAAYFFLPAGKTVIEANWLQVMQLLLNLFYTFFRTVVLYTSVLVMMRIMGKREVGQLSLFDLVVAIMIAELAAIPMEDPSVPLISGLLPIATLVLLEISLSMALLKSHRARRIIDGTPSIIIEKGRMLDKEMRRLRYGVEDLISQLREKGIYNLDDVEYAILEINGQLSIIPKSDKRPLVTGDLGLTAGYEGLPFPLIVDGKIEDENLAMANKNRKWLQQQVEALGCQVSDTLYAYLDSQGNVKVYKKGECKKRPGDKQR